MVNEFIYWISCDTMSFRAACVRTRRGSVPSSRNAAKASTATFTAPVTRSTDTTTAVLVRWLVLRTMSAVRPTCRPTTLAAVPPTQSCPPMYVLFPYHIKTYRKSTCFISMHFYWRLSETYVSLSWNSACYFNSIMLCVFLVSNKSHTHMQGGPEE